MSPPLRKFYMSFAVLCILFQLAAAVPATARAGSSFVINQIPSTKGTTSLSKHPGIAAYAKALRKHGASKGTIDRLSSLAVQQKPKSSTWASKAASSGISNPIAASPFVYDKEYDSPVTIGNQTFVMDLDTGSSDLWVFGKSTNGLLPNQTVYVPGSTASRVPGESFSELYGDNSMVLGIVYTDVVNIGGIQVKNQSIEVATKFEGDFAQEDGIVGLAFDSINQIVPTPQKTLFTNLRSSLSSPVLSADLRHQEVGCYTFGAIPSNQYTPPLTYTSVNTARGLWEFSPAGYGVGSNTTLNASSSDLEKLIGIVDTGTTLMLLDDTIVQTYYEHVPTARFEGGLEAWVFDCGVAGNLPDFRVKVGSKGQSKGQGEFEAVVPGAYLNYAPNPDGTSCYGGLQPTLGEIPFGIYGDIFLKSVFAVFDRGSQGGQPRLAFAAKA